MEGSIKISGIIRESIVDGPGIRFVVFTQGCPHGCEGCHNPQTHEFSGGKWVTVKRLLQEIDGNPLLRGVTLSGGEPMTQAAACLPFAREVRRRGLSLMIYTGYTYEQLMERGEPAVEELISLCDYMVDGRFDLAQRNLLLHFRGSENQRIIDVARTLEQGAVVTADL